MSRPGASLLLVTVLLAGGVTGTYAVDARSSRAPAGRSDGFSASAPRAAAAPVTSAVAVCPSAEIDGADAGAWVTASAPAPEGVTATTAAPATALVGPRGGAPTARLDAPGAVTVRAPAADPVTGRASGALAPGFAVSLTTRSPSGRGRGIADVACPAPAAEWWFLVGSTRVGDRGRLHLANPTGSAAVVDLTVRGTGGPVPGGTRAVSLAGGATRVIALDALAPGLDAAAVHVVARRGTVAAALLQREASGLTPHGVDWVPPAAAPATRLVVPGVGQAFSRALRIVAPGAGDAVVRLRLLGPGGPRIPPGGGVVEVPADTVRQADLDALFGAAAWGAVELTADVPVTAAVEMRSPESPLGDFSYTAAAPPLDGPASAHAGSGGGWRSTLLLTAPQSAAEVRVDAAPTVPGGAAPPATTVAVPAGRSVAVPLVAPGPQPASFTVTVRPQPGSGPVYAARALGESGARGPLTTTRVLVATPRSAVVPAVTGDVRAVLRLAG